MRENSFAQNILRILKGIPKTENTSEIGRKKELKALNAEFKDYVVKYQDIIIDGLSNLLLTSIYDKPLPKNKLSELGKNLDKVIKSNDFRKNFDKLKRVSEILDSMLPKEQYRFISEQLGESLKNIRKIKDEIHYNENIFILMSYLTVIENIIGNLIPEIKSITAKKHIDGSSHIIILTSAMMCLSIVLISYYKGKIDLEGLDRYLIKIEIELYRQGLADYVTFYGIKN